MATKKDKNYLLETMEEGQNEVSYAKSVEITRMESTQNGELSQRLLESGKDAEWCTNK